MKARTMRAATLLFFSAITFLAGAVAMWTGATLTGFASTGADPLPVIYGYLVIAVAIGAPVVFLLMAVVAAVWGEDPPRRPYEPPATSNPYLPVPPPSQGRR
jgi:hypothetical protein